MKFWEAYNNFRRELKSLDYNAAFSHFRQLEKMSLIDADSDVFNSRQAFISRVKAELGLHTVDIVKPSKLLGHSNISISFVTSVFNRYWQLKETLPNNLEIIRNNENCELVIVDFCGEDTQQIERLISEKYVFDLFAGRLKYYKINQPWTKFHMAAAKNAACRLSHHEIIFSLDADNFLHPSDVKLVRETFSENPDRILHQTTGPSPIMHSQWRRYSLFDQYAYHEEPITWDGSSGRIATTRKLFEKINGYNEKFLGMGMDDVDFLFRGIKLGAKYLHSSLDRPVEEVFLDNGSASEEHVHSDNDENWKKMDALLQKGSARVEYSTKVPIDIFSKWMPECCSLGKDKVALIANAFQAAPFVNRLRNDIADILANSADVHIFILDIIESNDKDVTEELKDISNGSENINYIPVYKDPGLYETWNSVIRNINAEYIGNLNIDDLRGRDWVNHCLRDLKQGSADVSSPLTFPFRDANISHYNEISREDLNKESCWYRYRVKYDHATGKREQVEFPQGRYTHEDMFQMNERGIESYCITNASSIWRRKIHDAIGYFDEKRYGVYTDFAFWLQASEEGFRFKQNDGIALFYLSDQQAHKKQENNEMLFRQLVCKYAPEDYQLYCCSTLYDLSMIGGTYGDHHLLGWNWVRDHIAQNFTDNPKGLILDLFVERTFFWNRSDPNRCFSYRMPWVGFIHTTPHNNSVFNGESENLDSLLSESRFISSLSFCKALIVLSKENKSYLEKAMAKLNAQVPIFALYHPNIPVTNEGADSAAGVYDVSGKIFHVGAHLRSFTKFAELNFPKEHKVLLAPGHIPKDYFINKIVNEELRSNGLGEIKDYVGDIYTATPAEYQAILREGIIFNYYIQPSGSNLISESITAGAQLILNRNPTFEEYLGENYPLFYDTPQQAEALIKKLRSDNAIKDQILRPYLAKLNERFSIGSFVSDFVNISKSIIRAI